MMINGLNDRHFHFVHFAPFLLCGAIPRRWKLQCYRTVSVSKKVNEISVERYLKNSRGDWMKKTKHPFMSLNVLGHAERKNNALIVKQFEFLSLLFVWEQWRQVHTKVRNENIFRRDIDTQQHACKLTTGVCRWKKNYRRFRIVKNSFSICESSIRRMVRLEKCKSYREESKLSYIVFEEARKKFVPPDLIFKSLNLWFDISVTPNYKMTCRSWDKELDMDRRLWSRWKVCRGLVCWKVKWRVQ